MADPFDSGFELLPSDEAELSPDEELAAALGLEDLDQEDIPVPLGRGWLFDFENSQFFRHGAAPAAASDVAHLRVWIEKTLRTARFAHPIYSDDYGVEMPDRLYGHVFSPEIAGKLTTTIEEALLAHDRINQVKDFNFTGSPTDTLLELSFTVVLDEEELTLENVPVARAV